eukprot:gnl/MRDRNA2_/MRDRNA2_36301_c0_seq1.p1 gnl/MRDRNA2_/MRDRNA2_36301_c0~~gnl/MRDRNA2_/MRDRNA2_36301_c0_seq1.p1  ORF type:complete len:161 (-),score=20.92 gnl/MRDRNA2_/MRDRNA2_36301_c0_seq1:61-543(-)
MVLCAFHDQDHLVMPCQPWYHHHHQLVSFNDNQGDDPTDMNADNSPPEEPTMPDEIPPSTSEAGKKLAASKEISWKTFASYHGLPDPDDLRPRPPSMVYGQRLAGDVDGVPTDHWGGKLIQGVNSVLDAPSIDSVLRPDVVAALLPNVRLWRGCMTQNFL